jgi:hypothetical protein
MFICGEPNHKSFDYLHWWVATLEMFKDKKANSEPKKENVAINMVLAVITKI